MVENYSSDPLYDILIVLCIANFDFDAVDQKSKEQEVADEVTCLLNSTAPLFGITDRLRDRKLSIELQPDGWTWLECVFSTHPRHWTMFVVAGSFR